MSRHVLLGKPHWQRFLDLPGLGELSTPSLHAADDFFGFVARHGLASPKAADLALWSSENDTSAPAERLDLLSDAMAVCVPSFVPFVKAAKALLPSHDPAEPRASRSTKSNGKPEPVPQDFGIGVTNTGPWDPIARPATKPPVARHVSIPPDALPLAWQAALRRMAKGLPQNNLVVCLTIVLRMREKLCQLAWSAQRANLAVEITEETVNRYQADLTSRGEKGPNGLRWATLRASAEELHRFSRYIGLPLELQHFLSDRRDLLERREKGQTALKHFALARTGNTTDGVLDMADALLTGVDALLCPKKRHQMRNGACILGLYPIAPLRPASADLVFGRTLFWRNNEWVIDTPIQKTLVHNPERFVMPLAPDHGKFIDAVVLGDGPLSLLPKMRLDAISRKGQLFVLPNGMPTAKTYIPRLYKALTGNSLGTSRTMLHTDLGIADGIAGTHQAMIACHQTSLQTAERYKQATVAIHSILRRQAAGSRRRLESAKDNRFPSLGFLEP